MFIFITISPVFQLKRLYASNSQFEKFPFLLWLSFELSYVCLFSMFVEWKANFDHYFTIFSVAFISPFNGRMQL